MAESDPRLQAFRNSQNVSQEVNLKAIKVLINMFLQQSFELMDTIFNLYARLVVIVVVGLTGVNRIHFILLTLALGGAADSMFLRGM